MAPGTAGQSGGRTVELDVRDYQRRGEEPFSAIMATVSELGPEDTFVLINTFEPVPLYRVLGNRGYDHAAEELGPEHWRITFTPRSQA